MNSYVYKMLSKLGATIIINNSPKGGVNYYILLKNRK